MTNFDVIKKVIGKIHPVGESNEDQKRFDNLTQYCEAFEEMFREISEIASEADSPYGSIKKAGTFAKTFLKEIRESIEV